MKGNVERPLVFIINRPAVSEQKNCPKCTVSSGMITPDEATALTGVSTRAIYRRLDDGHIHFIETPRGELFICVKTLVANMNS